VGGVDVADAQVPNQALVAQLGERGEPLGNRLTDEAAARQLGTSLRTYRRRVAELMATLQAGSRFQAGVRAGELGLAH